MKKESHKWVFALFLCALIGITVGVNSYVDKAQAGRRVRVREQAITEAAALKRISDHTNRLASYINSNYERKAGIPNLAVAAASETDEINETVRDALVNHFQGAPAAMHPAFFKASFLSDGLLTRAFSETSDLGGELELTNFLNGALLAKQSVSYSTSPELQNLITASMELEVIYLRFVPEGKRSRWTFRANGPGFSNPAARAIAEERILKQLSANTNMSLGL